MKLDERLISARVQPHSSAIQSHGTYFCFCTRSNIASLLFQSSKPTGPDCSVGRRWKSYRTALLGRWRSHRLVNSWASISGKVALPLIQYLVKVTVDFRFQAFRRTITLRSRQSNFGLGAECNPDLYWFKFTWLLDRFRNSRRPILSTNKTPK